MWDIRGKTILKMWHGLLILPKKTQNSEKEISAWMLEIDPGLVSALILNF